MGKALRKLRANGREFWTTSGDNDLQPHREAWPAAHGCAGIRDSTATCGQSETAGGISHTADGRMLPGPRRGVVDTDGEEH